MADPSPRRDDATDPAVPDDDGVFRPATAVLEAALTPESVLAETSGSSEAVTEGPSGWRRVLIGLAVGVVAGALLALLLPRDATERRTGPGGRQRLGDHPSHRGPTGRMSTGVPSAGGPATEPPYPPPSFDAGP